MCVLLQMEEDIVSLINQVAKNENWQNFDVNLNLDNVQANGIVSKIFFVTIKNKDTAQMLQLVIKKSFKNPQKRAEMQIEPAFSNEIFFYTRIATAFTKFLKEKGLPETLNFLCKCYLTSGEKLNEALIFENIKSIGYEVVPKDVYLNEEYMLYVFETFGVFHGLSFAYKDQRAEDYKKLTARMVDFFPIMKEDSMLPTVIRQCSEQILDYLQGPMKDHCKDFFQNSVNEFFDTLTYSGKYSCILHGDCWPNNMMFKNMKKLEGIKIIDFQFCRIGSPVKDLSFVFYSGVKKELYSNYNKYLRVYYESLSKTVSELGSDPNEILPFKVLVKDWKKYSKFGLFKAFIIRKIKLLPDDIMQDLTADNDMVFKEMFNNAKIDTKLYIEEIMHLVQHFYDSKFI